MTKAGFLLRCLAPCVICTDAPVVLAFFLGFCLSWAWLHLSVSFQVWLCYDAEVAKQSHSGETVGAAMDQKLFVWGSVEEDATQLFLSAPSVGHRGNSRRQAEEPLRASFLGGVWDKGMAALLLSSPKASP